MYRALQRYSALQLYSSTALYTHSTSSTPSLRLDTSIDTPRHPSTPLDSHRSTTLEPPRHLLIILTQQRRRPIGVTELENHGCSSNQTWLAVSDRENRRNSDNVWTRHARHMTPTAAASVGARRRRPSPPTDGSHGRAVSKNLGRCAPAGCSATSGRSPETPGSLPSTPGPEGERQWSAASATLRSAPRPHRLRRASMARRSTAACSVCSWHSVQPRQAL